MSRIPRVLVVSSDHENREKLVQLLAECGVKPVVSATIHDGVEKIHHERFSMVFCWSALPDGGYREMLRQAAEEKWKKPVVVASRLADAGTYLEAMRLGAFDFIACPYGRSEVERIVHQAIEKVMAA